MYGISQWGDLFTARQKLALVTLARLVRELPAEHDGAVREGLAIVVNRCADRSSTICRWDNPWQKIANTFARQALPMVWDFCEGNPLSDYTGGYDGALEWVVKVVDAWLGSSVGQSQCADAAVHPLPNETAAIWFTDPPYYDSVPYSYISDFFYIWLRRSLGASTHMFASNSLTPKEQEIVAYVKYRAFRRVRLQGL